MFFLYILLLLLKFFSNLFCILIHRIVNNSYYYHVNAAAFLNIKIQIKVSEKKEIFNNNSKDLFHIVEDVPF